MAVQAAPLAVGCAVLHFSGAPLAHADVFSWLGGSGDFSSWGNWRDFKNQSFDPPLANPLHRTPGASDIVSFPQDQGAFTVNIATAEVAGTAIFDSFTGSVVTLNLTGSYQMGESQLANVRFMGDGVARSNKILLHDSVLSGVRAEFANLDLEGTLTLQDLATLITNGPLNFTASATLNDGTWLHAGIMPGGEIHLLNGSQLVVRQNSEADAPSTPRLRVEGGSTVDMDAIEARVDASGAASVTFKQAVLYSEPAFLNPAAFSGGGTTLTVSERLVVIGGPLQLRGGGRLQVVNLSHDQGAFSTEAIDSGSAINVTGLLDGGTVSAKDGATVSVASAKNSTLEAIGADSTLALNGLESDVGKRVAVNVRAGGVLTAGAIEVNQGEASGTIVNPGSRLVLSGNLEMADGAWTVDDGGRMDCALAAFGRNANVTVSGANSFLLARKGLILGERAGTSTLTISRAGHVQTGVIGETAAITAIGLGGGADARLFVTGGGVFDGSLGELGMGIGAKGQMTVSTGGRVLAANLTLGALAGGDGLITGNGADGSIEVAEVLRVGGEGVGRVNLNTQFIATAKAVHVGDSAADNLFTVAGGAELRFTEALAVGHLGHGTVRVTTGGLVMGSGLQPYIGLGDQATTAAGTFEISGAGSRVVAPANGVMIVGASGQGTLQVGDGGALEFAIASIGGAGGSTGTATVRGAGSRWTLTNSLDVGGFGQPVPGILTVAADGVVRVNRFLGVTSAGVVSLNGGRISVGAGDAATGTLRVGAGGTLKLGGRITGGKVIIGVGGKFLPGRHSPGLARLEGGFEQEADGVLEMEIAGPDAGTSYDQIAVTGTAALNGELVVRFTNGYAPTSGQVFDLLSATAVIDSFATVTIEGVQPGFQHQVRTTPEGHFQLVAQTTGTAATSPLLPELSIENVNGFVVVSYPLEVIGWHLQTSPDLTSAASWAMLDASEHRLTLVPAAARQFFRLVKP